MVQTKEILNGVEVERISHNVLYIFYKDNHTVELEDVIELNDYIYEMSEQGQFKIYTIVRSTGNFTSFSREAFLYLSKDAPIVRKRIVGCTATIINNLPSRMISRFFLNFYKPQYPMRLFPSYEKAQKWINELMLKEKKSTAR